MGDRTRVTLSFLASQQEKLDSLLGKYDQPDTVGKNIDGGGIVEYIYDEVNYGNLDFLDRLRDAGVAYDSSWDSGGEYTSGTAYCRFTEDGDCVEKSIYDDDINPNLHSLLALIETPAALVRYIRNHEEAVSVIFLDESQVEYGKRYLAKKLIAP